MKGSSKMVGAQELAAACEGLERAARAGNPEDLQNANTVMDRAMDRLGAHLAAATRADTELI
jgi:HPt (histidine-containing phosphotransfer) domain-containing protein